MWPSSSRVGASVEIVVGVVVMPVGSSWLRCCSLLRCSSSLRGSSWLRCGPNRVEDLLVAGAAAEVARESLADLVIRRARRVIEQVDGGDDQARRAEPALHGSGS